MGARDPELGRLGSRDLGEEQCELEPLHAVTQARDLLHPTQGRVGSLGSSSVGCASAAESSVAFGAAKRGSTGNDGAEHRAHAADDVAAGKRFARGVSSVG